MLQKRRFGRHSLRTKLIAGSLAVELIMLSILVWNGIRLTRDHMIQATEYRINALKPLLNTSLSSPLLEQDFARLEEIIEQLMRDNGFSYMGILTHENEILLKRGTRSNAGVENNGISLREHIIESEPGTPYLVKTAIQLNGQLIGGLEFEISTDFIAHAINSLSKQNLIIAAIEIALSVLFLTALGIALTRKLYVLTDAAHAMSLGDLSVRVDVKGKGEIKATADAFNDMAEKLERSTNKLRAQYENMEALVDKRTEALRRHSDALEEGEKRLRAILESAADGIIVTDEDGKIELFNPASQAIFGFESRNAIGEHIGRLITSHGARDSANPLQAAQALEKDKSTAEEMTGIHREGRRFPAEVTCSSVMLKNRILRIYVIRDITERKQNQQALEQTTRQLAEHAAELERKNKELDQFAYITSHDLKAPLRAISNLSTWIEEDIGEALSDDGREQMKLLRGRVTRMENLINAILEYSRIGRVQVKPEFVDVSHILDETIDAIAAPATFNITYDRNMPSFQASNVLFGQVFANLISNAVKYHDQPNGNVTISVSEDKDFYEFSVADDGPGIDPEYHEKVFQIFQTLQARDSYESTGIGLTIVQKIIQEQGGRIWIESAPSRGTIFRFTWPKVPKAA